MEEELPTGLSAEQLIDAITVFIQAYFIFVILVALLGAAICGCIAAYKNRSFVGWFIAGSIVWLVAFIIILSLPKVDNGYEQESELELYEDIDRYKKLYDDGVISSELYNEKKEEITEEINNLYSTKKKRKKKRDR